MTDAFIARIRKIIDRIPPGMVTTYGIVAEYAGNRRGARQVARVLCSSSEKYGLPWHRVVNRDGRISPRPSMGHLLQRLLLEEEGVIFEKDGRIDLVHFLWRPQGSNEWFD